MKIPINWMLIVLFGGGTVLCHDYSREPTPIYPEATDPRVSQCDVTDIPLPSLSHYHLLADRGFHCYTIRDKKAVKAYRLAD